MGCTFDFLDCQTQNGEDPCDFFFGFSCYPTQISLGLGCGGSGSGLIRWLWLWRFFFFLLLLFVVAADLVGGRWRRWWVDVDGVGGCGGYFFFSLLLFVIVVDLAGGWWRRWWVAVVVVIWVGEYGGRRRWVEKERHRDRERKIKK